MAIAATHIETTADAVGGTSKTTSSQSPTTNSLQLFLVGNQVTSGTVGIPTLSGNSLTWVQVATQISSDNLRRATLFRALGTASTGVVTMDYAGVNQLRTGWSWSQYSGIDTSGTNGSNAIVQSTTGQVTNGAPATGITLTLAAFSNINNAAYGALRYGNSSATDNVLPGTGFTQLGIAAGNASYQSQYDLSNQTSVSWTWNSGSFFSQAIGVEIKAFVSSPASSGQSGSMGLNNLGDLSSLGMRRIII